jgi:hypothetical protein
MKIVAQLKAAKDQIVAQGKSVVTTAVVSALTVAATAQAAPVAGGTNDPIAVLKTGACGANGILKYMTDPTLVGIALVVTVAGAAWAGWMFGNKNSATGAKTGFIAAACVLGCSTIAGAFVGGC